MLFNRMGAWIGFGRTTEAVEYSIGTIPEDISPSESPSSLLSPDFQTPCSTASTMDPITNGELNTSTVEVAFRVRQRLISTVRWGRYWFRSILQSEATLETMIYSSPHDVNVSLIFQSVAHDANRWIKFVCIVADNAFAYVLLMCIGHFIFICWFTVIARVYRRHLRWNKSMFESSILKASIRLDI